MRPPGTIATVALDLGAATVFAVIGRSSHAEGLTLPGVLATVWPFALGAALGAGSVRLALPGTPLRAVRAGAVVWPVTVVVGMAVRAMTGAGTAWSFVLVATGFLGVVLLGWRGLGLLASRSGRSRSAPARTTPAPPA